MPSTTDISLDFAEFAASTRFSDLPPEVVDAAKRSILDTIGVMLAAGGREPAVRPILDQVIETGERPEATIVGFGARAPAAAAAFANGTLAHALDFDSQTAWGAHPDSSLIPALLAVAEREGGISGEDLVTAVAVGQEVFIRLRCNVRWNMDWNLSSVVGTYAAVAACGSLRRLDADRIAAAMGIASVTAGGTMQQIFGTGSDLRGLYAGFIAQSCVTAIALAERGMAGIPALFEGEAGVFAVYFRGDYDREPMVRNLGSEFAIGGMTYKYWPAVGNAHTYIHAALELVGEHPLRLDEIERVIVHVGDFAERMSRPLEVRRTPRTMLDARFSLPFVVALALTRGRIDVADLVPEALADPDVLALAAKVEPSADPDLDWGLKLPPGRVEVVLRDGTRLERAGVEVPGSPDRPMTWQELVRKFESCARAASTPIAPARIADLIDIIGSIEACRDVERLVEPLR